MYQRTHLQELIKRMQEPRRCIQVIVGPRQVGKTTLLKQFRQQTNQLCHIVSADAIDSGESTWLKTQWEIAIVTMQQKKLEEVILIIDEIQKIYNWSEIIKSLWDQNTFDNINVKVILTGSSRVVLQKGLSESLAGRFEYIFMGHWTYIEMNEAFGFNLQQYIWFGGYPGSAMYIKDENRWKEYIKGSLIQTAILKDVLLLTKIEKPALLKRLFELGCLYSGKELSYTKIMGQLQDVGNTTTLSSYLDLLEIAGLLSGLEKFSPSIIRQRASSPKFQVHNTALISGQMNESFEEILLDQKKWGNLVESAVGAYLLNQTINTEIQLHYWREGEKEVDFVLTYQDKSIGIEVKSNHDGITQGMNAFDKKFNPYKMLLVGDAGIPLDMFLKMNIIDLFK